MENHKTEMYIAIIGTGVSLLSLYLYLRGRTPAPAATTDVVDSGGLTGAATDLSGGLTPPALDLSGGGLLGAILGTGSNTGGTTGTNSGGDGVSGAGDGGDATAPTLTFTDPTFASSPATTTTPATTAAPATTTPSSDNTLSSDNIVNDSAPVAPVFASIPNAVGGAGDLPQNSVTTPTTFTPSTLDSTRTGTTATVSTIDFNSGSGAVDSNAPVYSNTVGNDSAPAAPVYVDPAPVSPSTFSSGAGSGNDTAPAAPVFVDGNDTSAPVSAGGDISGNDPATAPVYTPVYTAPPDAAPVYATPIYTPPVTVIAPATVPVDSSTTGGGNNDSAPPPLLYVDSPAVNSGTFAASAPVSSGSPQNDVTFAGWYWDPSQGMFVQGTAPAPTVATPSTVGGAGNLPQNQTAGATTPANGTTVTTTPLAATRSGSLGSAIVNGLVGGT